MKEVWTIFFPFQIPFQFLVWIDDPVALIIVDCYSDISYEGFDSQFLRIISGKILKNL